MGAPVRLRHHGDHGNARRRAHGLGAQPWEQRGAVGLRHRRDHLHQLRRPRQPVPPARGRLERVQVHVLPSPRELPIVDTISAMARTRASSSDSPQVHHSPLPGAGFLLRGCSPPPPPPAAATAVAIGGKGFGSLGESSGCSVAWRRGSELGNGMGFGVWTRVGVALCPCTRAVLDLGPPHSRRIVVRTSRIRPRRSATS